MLAALDPHTLGIAVAVALFTIAGQAVLEAGCEDADGLDRAACNSY